MSWWSAWQHTLCIARPSYAAPQRFPRGRHEDVEVGPVGTAGVVQQGGTPIGPVAMPSAPPGLSDEPSKATGTFRAQAMPDGDLGEPVRVRANGPRGVDQIIQRGVELFGSLKGVVGIAHVIIQCTAYFRPERVMRTHADHTSGFSSAGLTLLVQLASEGSRP